LRGDIKMEKPQCPICFSESLFWGKLKDYRESVDKHYDMYKCTFCGHGFHYPGAKNKEELLECYGEDYDRLTYDDIDEAYRLKKIQHAKDVELLKKYVTKDDVDVLDFGCSKGMFLDAMPKEWRKFGFEVNPTEIEILLKNFKDIGVIDNISDISQQKFDIITLRGVIEHLFDFDEIFSIVNSSLKDNGIVYICATPDFSSPCASLYRELWNQIGAPSHYHQFTTSSLAILFGKNGFGLKAIHHPYIDTPYADFENDVKKFNDNVKRFLQKEDLKETSHAFPGTMVSMVFEKI